MKQEKIILDRCIQVNRIFDRCMKEQHCANSLLLSQMATNPRAFKLSAEAIANIELMSNFKNKLLVAIEYALKEKLVLPTNTN